MDISIIFNFSGIGYEVWITNIIQTDAGMGSVFDSENEAVEYSTNHGLPVLNLSDFVIEPMNENATRNFLKEYLELNSLGEIISVKPSKYYVEPSKAV